MTPELRMALVTVMFTGAGCVIQKLAAVKMAIRTEYDTQKAAASDVGVDQSQFTRKLNDAEAFTFRDLDKLSLEAQRVALLEMLAELGLPQRAKRWLSIARVFDAREEKRSA
jgi:hypothetical protein